VIVLVITLNYVLLGSQVKISPVVRNLKEMA